MGAEFGTFLNRQQEMLEAHREQENRVSEPKPLIVLDETQKRNNDEAIARLRTHILELRGQLIAVSALPAEHSRQLAKWGKIYDRGEL